MRSRTFPKRQPSPPPPPAPAPRKAAAAPTAREWLVVAADGRSHLEEAGRQSVMRRTGLPPRDLRLLDPLLSYPSTILARERAIVINLEHIKAIISASDVMIPNSKDPLVQPLIHDLQYRLTVGHTPLPADVEARKAVSGCLSPKNDRPEKPSTDDLSPKNDRPEKPSTDDSHKEGGTPKKLVLNGDMLLGNPRKMKDVPRCCCREVLPFEFRALELCLESACNSLELESSLLEKEAYPALDELTSKVSTLNLERIRQIKSRFVALAGRVQKVRDELDRLLEDDMDMAAMHLSEKLVYKAAYGASSRFEFQKDPTEPLEERAEDLLGGAESSYESLVGFKPNIHELEMLLEAYFVQTDATLNKLSILREYIHDTEDYINIMLDDKQNQLLQMGVILTTATMIGTCTVIVTGYLATNVHIGIYDSEPSAKFWDVVWGVLVGGFALFVTIYICYRKGGLLQ